MGELFRRRASLQYACDWMEKTPILESLRAETTQTHTPHTHTVARMKERHNLLKPRRLRRARQPRTRLGSPIVPRRSGDCSSAGGQRATALSTGAAPPTWRALQRPEGPSERASCSGPPRSPVLSPSSYSLAHHKYKLFRPGVLRRKRSKTSFLASCPLPASR